MKRICLCLLSLMLIASLLLCGCGDRGPVVMEYDGIRLTEDIYRYWISCYKAQFAYELNEENEEELAALTARFENEKMRAVIDRMIDGMDKEGKRAICTLCLCILASDKTLTPKENTFLLRLMQ